MDFEIYTRNIWIILGTLCGLGVLIAFIRTWTWYSKSGKNVIDLHTLGKLFLHIFGIISTTIFIVMSAVSIWWLVFFKKQYDSTFEFQAKGLERIFKILLIVSFLLKTLDIIHLVIRQTTIDIFFIDWERPKSGNPKNISAWRTCFVANEFNEIQTFRRINVSFHLLFVLFLLKVINLEHLATIDTNMSLSLSSSFDNSTIQYNPIFRMSIAFPVLLGTAFVQYFFYIIIYQHFIEDKIMNFIDLCSVSNISVFILDQAHHGFYIHGRSPHGMTDVNIKDMIMNLDRESRSLSGTRGLEVNSSEQMFIMKIAKSFRKEYDILFRKYYDYVRTRRRNEDLERYTDILLQSYRTLNEFLCAFINHSLPMYQYTIRNRYFIEKILNYEFQLVRRATLLEYSESLLFVDTEKIFTEILFYGEETTLFMWNIITFIFVDFLSSNYILAAVITYLLNQIIVSLRNSFGRKNLSRKTLVPRELLI